MSTPLRSFIFICGCILCGPGAEPIAADTEGSSALERITQYGKAIESLNERANIHRQGREKLADEFQRLYLQYSAAGTEAAQINAQARTEFQIWFSTVIQRQESVEQLNSARASADRNAGRELRIRALQTGALASEELNREQRVRQLQLAQQISEERRQRLEQDLAQLAVKTQAWKLDEFRLVKEYLSLSDIANIRSDLELKSARRLFQSEAEQFRENEGARLALAITLFRMSEIDKAQFLLDELITDGNHAAIFAKAVRCELLALTSKEQINRRDLTTLKSSQLPEVIHFVARAYTKLGMEKPAVDAWNSLLPESEHEVVARCHLALMRGSLSSAPTRFRQAADDARLAHDLSGGDDWYCKLTLAICLAKNSQPVDALRLCQEATILAIGDKKRLCADIAEQLQNGQPVQWDW